MVKWFLGEDGYKKRDLTAIEELNRSFMMAAKCRYLASARLKHLGEVASHTTTLLSMLLIFMPLMQIAGLEFSFPTVLMNVIQVFLAVSVLVFSVINTKARYSLRAEKLNQCGDKIKELQRQLSFDLNNNKSPCYQDFHNRYLDIEVDSENHARVDYCFARLHLSTIYNLNGVKRLVVIINAYLRKWFTFIGPVFMFLMASLIILDMLKIISVLSDILVPLLPKG
ncbi:hypothetical protein TW82_11320 [Pseudoalteromonas fuliginea]|nr:hypothetical protein TW82_11320 [Pseudoalteromonas fuliginea]